MQGSNHQTTEHAAPSRDAAGHGPSDQRASGREATGHGVSELDAPAHGASERGAAEHGAGAHGGEHHQEFNWVHGIVGVKEGVEPSLLWRTPDMPTPFAAVLFNTALLFGLLYKFARGPVAKGLVDRRQRIMRGIEEATAMKDEAKRQLDSYRHKLDTLDAEIERVKREMREGAELERRRILDDAAARRTRLEQEAVVLIDQELKAIREALTRETAQAALRSARELLLSNTSTDDHRRLCEQYLETLGSRSTRQSSQQSQLPEQPPASRGDLGGRS
jgi:F0F1-type ATP synthase membrane subunit b/b'